MRRFALIAILAIVASLLWTSAAFAFRFTHGTSLNTIPTTEIRGEGEFEWDLTLGVSEAGSADLFFSEDGRFLEQEFFAGLFEDFEFGMAFNGEREVGPFVLFGKYRIFDENEDNFPVSLAVGIDNIVGTKDRFVSEPISYVVIGKNFDRANGYVGFAHNASGLQDDDSIFGGFDYDWNEDWTFAADYYGILSNEEATISGGLYYDWVNHFDIRGWVSYKTATEDTLFVIELAFTGRFDDLEAEV